MGEYSLPHVRHFRISAIAHVANLLAAARATADKVDAPIPAVCAGFRPHVAIIPEKDGCARLALLAALTLAPAGAGRRWWSLLRR